jgi:hypothetical protein
MRERRVAKPPVLTGGSHFNLARSGLQVAGLIDVTSILSPALV